MTLAKRNALVRRSERGSALLPEDFLRGMSCRSLFTGDSDGRWQASSYRDWRRKDARPSAVFGVVQPSSAPSPEKGMSNGESGPPLSTPSSEFDLHVPFHTERQVLEHEDVVRVAVAVVDPVALVEDVEDVDVHFPLRLTIEQERVQENLVGDVIFVREVAGLFALPRAVKPAAETARVRVRKASVHHPAREPRNPIVPRRQLVPLETKAVAETAGSLAERVEIVERKAAGLRRAGVVEAPVIVGDVERRVETQIGLVDELHLGAAHVQVLHVAAQLKFLAALVEERHARVQAVLQPGELGADLGETAEVREI